MKNINKWLRSIFKNRQMVFIGIVLGLVIVFKQPIVIFLNKFWVNPVASKVTSSFPSDIVFILCFIGIVGFYLLRFKTLKHYYPNWKVAVLSLIVSIFYIFARFSKKTSWIFTGTQSCPQVRYTDIVIITGLISGILLIWLIIILRKKAPSNSKNYFFNDAPLEVEKNEKWENKDKYHFKTYANEVAQGINQSIFGNAFAIGIAAKWGTGKTSFINMVKSEVSEGVITIDFNPWRSSSPTGIISDFFQTLQENLADYGFHINKQILRYAQKIVAINQSVIGNGISTFLDFWVNDISLKKMFDDINNTLKKIDKKLLIVIDDVDRLSESEVMEVIKLIRNTANFYNTFFIVAYDKPYVLGCLKNKGVPDYETFLEKIFQLEITLPPFDKQVLIDRLMEDLSPSISRDRIGKINAALNKDSHLRDTLFEWLKTFRDVTLLSNSIKVNIANKVKDVDLIDFIFIELLRVKFPAVYVTFFEHYKEWFRDENGLFKEDQRFFSLGFPKSKEVTKERPLLPFNGNITESYLAQYLKIRKDDLLLTETSIVRICKMLKCLFGTNGQNTFDAREFENCDLSIIHSMQFDYYYSYQIPRNKIPNSIFISTLQQPLYKIKTIYKEWFDKGMGIELLRRIQGINCLTDIRDSEALKNFILSYFFYANLVNASPTNRYRVIGSNGLIFCLEYGRATYFLNDSEGYQDFITNIFSPPDQIPYAQAKFLKEYLDSIHIRNEENPVIEKGFAIDKLVSYLEEVCNSENKLSKKIWRFYNCCNAPSLVPDKTTHEYANIPKADEIFKQFISEKDLEGYLPLTIVKDQNDEPGYQLSTKVINQTFFQLEKFEEFLSNQDESKWKTLKEYRQFYEKAKNTNEFIAFNFRTIDSHEIRERE